MANYCFKDGRQAIWREGAARGYLAAILDFPRTKSHEESYAAAKSVPGEMRPEVCCISPGDEEEYHKLVIAGWDTFYQSLEFVSEREKVLEASVFKRMTWDEALRLVRQGLADPSAQAEVDQAYEHFLELAALEA